MHLIPEARAPLQLRLEHLSKTYSEDVSELCTRISTKLLGGRTLVRVYSDGARGGGFEPAEPSLEDVYFTVMSGLRGQRAAAADRVAS
jgi:hypothetical protein